MAVATGRDAVAAESSESGSAAARLRRLEDERDIRELLVEYGARLDARDFAGYAALFARDGEWIGGMGRAKGPAAIEAMLERGFGPTPAGFKNTSSFHLMTNFSIRIDGDRATAVSKLVYFIKGSDGAPTPSLAGHYDDVLVREDGTWRFQRRVVMGDIPVQDPLAAKPGAG